MFSVRKLLHTGTILFLAAGLTVSATPASAVAAPPVRCGDTITRDVTLRADLRCTGDALVIGANGVTVDLNQHVISGPRTSGVGITATQRSGLRIRNGAIIDFAWGVTLDSTRNTVIENVRLLRNGSDSPGDDGGVQAESVSGLRIDDGAIEAVASGTPAVVATNSTGIAIRGVRVHGGIDLSINTHGSLIADNIFRGGRVTASEANRTVVRDNHLTQSGIRVSESNAVTITGNDLTGGTIQLGIAVEDVTVQRNRLRASEFGLVIDGPARNTRVIENEFTNHFYGMYVRVGLLAVIDGLAVARNTFTDNGGNGLFFEAPAIGGSPARISVTGNRFTANGYASGENDAAGRPNDDGLHTNVPVGSDIVVTGNRTQSNADHGIEALPVGSVRDGGGNVSTGDLNGCVGVVCR
ncbi:right-handed parallel beta-helix repeat-containing protein [Micromonospora sp. NBC_01796]|uniref:right-handed parallel beta-helix repeat-containing protein n=1 Tax=Micromonospora sp. NBC_01796 TaxID=2975987 RepID=UPI002DDA5BB6|nr:NosD domain-containing protein [Micromonospora sp. NBC_01796]WSA85457.1 hypothetical protein OIE47_34750 [Micromonospora sp. NBC_01796]